MGWPSELQRGLGCKATRRGGRYRSGSIARRLMRMKAINIRELAGGVPCLDALQGLPHTDCLGSKIGVEYASTKTARSGSFDLARTRNSSMHIPSRSICLPRTICVDGV